MVNQCISIARGYIALKFPTIYLRFFYNKTERPPFPGPGYPSDVASALQIASKSPVLHVKKQNNSSLQTMSPPNSLALGLDLSTQQLKVLAIDITNLETFYEKSLTFETDLAQYKTTKGVYTNDTNHEVYSPVEMWIEAVDVIISQMKDDDFPFERVAAISGAGQVLARSYQLALTKSNMPRYSGLRRPRTCWGVLIRISR